MINWTLNTAGLLATCYISQRQPPYDLSREVQLLLVDILYMCFYYKIFHLILKLLFCYIGCKNVLFMKTYIIMKHIRMKYCPQPYSIHTHTCAQTEEWSSRLGSEKGRLGSYGEITKDFLIWPNPIMNTEVDGQTDIKRDRGNILFVIRVKWGCRFLRIFDFPN